MINDNFKNILNSNSGQHLDSIYIPSASRYMLFKAISVGQVKTLSRLDMFDNFDLNVELLKLSLFDALLVEDSTSTNVNSNTITQIDYLAFLIGIKQLITTELTFKCECKICSQAFSHKIYLDKEFYSFFHDFKKQNLIFEKTDLDKNLWKFELSNFTMKNYLYFEYVLNELKEKNKDDISYASLKQLLYIENIYLNNEVIEDWQEKIITDKLKFFNNIPAFITINTSNNDCLLKFIEDNFMEEKIIQHVNDIKIVCPKCKNEYSNIYNFNDFFYVLGLHNDNGEIFTNIFNAEAQLIYNKWLTPHDINNMSYLDFKLCTETIFNLEEARQKQEEKALELSRQD